MLARIAGLLLQLHRDGHEPSVAKFPDWAMELVATAIPFDSAFWGAGCQVDGEVIPHSWWLHELPLESMMAWEQVKHLDTMGSLLVMAPGRVLNFSNEMLDSREHGAFYRAFLARYDIRQFMGSYAPNAATGIYDSLSLYRSDKAKPFSDLERQAFECLIPHLVEARRANYLNHSAATDGSASATIFFRAAADDKGVLHASEEGFVRLLMAEWPGWQGPRLPSALAAALTTSLDKRRGRHLGQAVALEFRRPLDVTLLYVRQRLPLDKLSPRQVEIARAYADGQSHKEIAQTYELSPATVRNHIGSIYQTLNIGSKAELASQLALHADYP